MTIENTLKLALGITLLIIPWLFWFRRMSIAHRAFLLGGAILGGYIGAVLVSSAIDQQLVQRTGWLSLAWSVCIFSIVALIATGGMYWRLVIGRRRWKNLSKHETDYPGMLETFKWIHDIKDDKPKP